METGLSVRQVQTTSFAPVRVEPAPQRQVARTELPEAQSVQAMADAAPVRVEQDGQQHLRGALNRAIDARSTEASTKVVIDRASQEVVYRKLSPSNGQVLHQYPDEAILRQKAYNAQQRRADLDHALESHTASPDDKVHKVA